MVISKRKIIVWSLIMVATLLWYWSIARILCQHDKDQFCTNIRKISAKVIPHIDLTNFYKTYIKKPACKISKAIGLKKDYEKEFNKLKNDFYKKLCSKKDMYIAPNVIYVGFRKEFILRLRKEGIKVYDEFIGHMEKNYPDIMKIEDNQIIKSWGQKQVFVFEQFPTFETEERIIEGFKTSPRFYETILYIEEPHYEYDNCRLRDCPQNRNEQTIKKREQVLKKLIDDKYLNEVIISYHSYKCAGGSSADGKHKEIDDFIENPEDAYRTFKSVFFELYKKEWEKLRDEFWDENIYRRDECYLPSGMVDKKEILIMNRFFESNNTSQGQLQINDLLYGYQWYIRAAPQQFDLAWRETMGDEKTEIAVIDMGTDLEHDDLSTTPFPQSISFVFDECDRDKNKCKNPEDTCGKIQKVCVFHGIKIHGLLNAKINNHFGIVGVAPKVRVSHIKAFGSMEKAGEIFGPEIINSSVGVSKILWPDINWLYVAEGIYYAVSSVVPHGCYIIPDEQCFGDGKYPDGGTPKERASIITINAGPANCYEQLKKSDREEKLKREVLRAIDKGIPVVVAAGNHGCSDSTPWDEIHKDVAASLNSRALELDWTKNNGLIIVGAMGRIAERAPYSNWSPEVDFHAFGGIEGRGTSKLDTEILTTTYRVAENKEPEVANIIGHGFTTDTGTSAAAPQVAGLVGMLLSVCKPYIENLREQGVLRVYGIGAYMEYLMRIAGYVFERIGDNELIGINAFEAVKIAECFCLDKCDSQIGIDRKKDLLDLFDAKTPTKSGKPKIKIDKPFPALSLNIVDLGFFEGSNKTTTVYLENLGGGNLSAKLKNVKVYTPPGSSKEWFKIKMKRIENNLYEITISTKINKKNLKEFKDGKYYAIIEIKTNGFLKGYETKKILVKMELYKGLYDINIANDVEKLAMVNIELYEKTGNGLQLLKTASVNIWNKYEFEFKGLDPGKEYFLFASIKVNGEVYSAGSYEVKSGCMDINNIEIRLEEVRRF